MYLTAELEEYARLAEKPVFRKEVAALSDRKADDVNFNGVAMMD